MLFYANITKGRKLSPHPAVNWRKELILYTYFVKTTPKLVRIEKLYLYIRYLNTSDWVNFFAITFFNY